MTEKFESLVVRLEKVVLALEKLPAGSSAAKPAASSSSSDDVAAFVAAFDTFLATTVKAAVEAGRALGNEDLTAQVNNVEEAFNTHRTLLLVASKSKKPNATTLPSVLEPLQKAIAKVTDGGKRNDFTNHLKGLVDGIAVLSWIVYEPAPVPYITEVGSSFMFHGNKILREYKGKDERHVEFVNKFKDAFTGLGEYVKEYHKTGLVWNANGKDAKDALTEASSAPAPVAAPAAKAGGPPAPPPPISVAELNAAASSATAAKPAAAPATAGLFAAINSGNVTSGLKKVTDDMKTHKNPNLRATAVVPAKETTTVEEKHQTGSAPAKPARIQLDGKTWWIEGQISNKEVVLEETNVKQSIFISGCKDSVIRVVGKVNQITIENSSKTGIVFESVVAAVDIVNCKKIQMQCTGTMSSLNIDKVQEMQAYLSNDCLGTSIITSLSCDVSIVLPGETPEQDPVEQPIPYQFQTRIVNGKLVTETVRHE